MGNPKCPCMDSGSPSPILFSSRVQTLQCRMFPKFGSGHPWISRISIETLMKGPERLVHVGEPIPDVFQFSYLNTPLPHVSGVRVQASLEIPDIEKNFAKRTQTPLPGSRYPITGAAHSSCMAISLPDEF